MKREQKLYRWDEELTVFAPGIPGTGNMDLARDYISEKLKKFGIEPGENNGFLLPAVTIGRFDALFLKEELKRAPLSLKLSITGKRKVSTVWTITGTLRGKSSSSILVGAHYCTAFSGAICDTAGVVGALALPISRLWTLCEMGPFDNLGIPSMCIQALNDDLLTTEDTWDKIDSKQLGYDINVYINLAEKLQKIPGRLLRRLEIPGKSLFGCGTLFSDTKMPDYPEGEAYSPEEAPPLYYGGVDGIVSIATKKPRR